jgi:hypothetical protein
MSDRSAAEGDAPEGGSAPPKNTGVKRPLVPVVLALMLGLAAAAWGVQIPRAWLVAMLAVLLVGLLLLFFGTKHKLKQGKNNPAEMPPATDDTTH